MGETQTFRQPRTATLDNRLYIEVRVLAERLNLNINDLLEEGMALVLEKHGIPDPRIK